MSTLFQEVKPNEDVCLEPLDGTAECGYPGCVLVHRPGGAPGTRIYVQDTRRLSLKAGFTPDPVAQKVEAGGPIVTKLGGVTAHVSKGPDVSIIFEAGGAPLTIYVESAADTTLLINTPDEKWVADDDSGGMLNPLVKFAQPKSGRYDVWVGTIGDKVAPAVLKITELK